jgi:hypothetical protein
MNTLTFWSITACNSVVKHRSSGDTYGLHLQGAEKSSNYPNRPYLSNILPVLTQKATVTLRCSNKNKPKIKRKIQLYVSQTRL